MKRITFIVSAILIFGVFPFSFAHAIKKCQDSDGNWHYGDIAVAQCNKSKVTTLNERGFIASEKDAPKTPEELEKEAAEKAKAEAEAERIQAEEDERVRILIVYETVLFPRWFKKETESYWLYAMFLWICKHYFISGNKQTCTVLSV